MLAIIVFRAGGRAQLAGGKAGSGGGVGVAGATTKRGGTPTQKNKKELGFFCGTWNPAV